MHWLSIFNQLIRMNQYQCILCSSTGFYASRINMFSQRCWIFCTNADLCQRAALGWSVQNEKNYPHGRIMGFIFIISCNRGKFVKKKRKGKKRIELTHHGWWIFAADFMAVGFIDQALSNRMDMPNQTIYSVMPRWTFNHYPSFSTKDCSLRCDISAGGYIL